MSNPTTDKEGQPKAAALGVVQVNVKGAGISRRDAMQWVMAAVAASALPTDAFGQPTPPPAPTPPANSPDTRLGPRQEVAAQQPGQATGKGYGVDPKLTPAYQPGAFWPLTFNDAQKKIVETLADLILPEDEHGPAASKLGVPAMVDEWISAPYPQQMGDRPVIMDGLVWIDTESTRRFKSVFVDATPEQQRKICDDICYAATAKPEFKKGAHFFSRFRSLCAGAYYGTPAGWKAIGYVGNVQLAKFDGPPPEVLQILGVEQTVK